MALTLTKNSKIIFAVSIVVLSAALGFLIWRVNQEDNLNPDDSEAGDSDNGTCWACCGSSTGVTCPTLTPEQIAAGWACSSGGLYCSGGSLCSCTTLCGDGVTIPIVCGANPAVACPNCYHAAPGSEEPVGADCNIGSQCDNKCYWPEVAFCTSAGECVCNGGSDNECEDENPTCTPSCPSGYSECSGAECSADTVDAECSARCVGCDNLYYDKITCDRDSVTNSCDSGAWVTRPTGSLNFDADISFSATATDSNGINNTSITAKLCTGNVAECTTGEAITYTVSNTNATSTTFGGALSSATDRLTPGTYTLSLAWADTLGATAASCKLTTVFTVQEEETNPNWDITKAVVELCIDESTPNPKSQLTYTVTVKNTGDAAGTISKIEDVLDSKILEDGVVPSNITTPGVYANGKITWTFTTPLSIAAGGSEVFTYKVIITKDNFGTYNNTVTLTPVDSSTIQATASITADCVITPEEIPETGIFDSTLGRIVAGLILVSLGGVVYNLPNGIFISNRKGTKFKYRTRFENKISDK